MRNRMSSLLIAVALALCGVPAHAEDYPASSGWSTFWGAFVDELTGEPGDAALKEKASFAQAGIRFDYPAVLRVQREEDGQGWRLWRGDVELVVKPLEWDDAQTPEQAMQGTIDSLALLQDILSKRDPQPPPSVQQTAHWCGRNVAGVAMRAHFVGDLHDFLEFKLPLGEGKAVSLSFEDIAAGGKSSRTLLATLAMVKDSLRCVDAKAVPKAEAK